MRLLSADKSTHYTLTDSCIDEASNEIVEYLESIDTDNKDILRIRITIEEGLICFQEHFGSDHPFSIKYGKTFGETKVSISVQGDLYDPFAKIGKDNSSSTFMRAALAAMGDLPTWRYSLGTNTISVSLKKKSFPDWGHLLIALVAAVAFGLLMQLLPTTFVERFTTEVLEPVLDTFMGFLGAISGPMIALAIIWGIFSIGDAAAFSAIGKRLVGRYFGYTAVITAVVTLVALPFFNFVYTPEASIGAASAAVGADGEASSGFGALFAMALNIIPDNLFTPFTTGDTLQILFVATIFGLAMLFVGEKTQTVAALMEQINILVQLIMNFISKLVPFFVFASLLDIILSNQISQIAACYKMLIVNVVAMAGLIVMYIVLVCRGKTVSPAKFCKKAMSTFIIGLTTASSSAAYATNRKTCSDEYGIFSHLADFGVPFGQVIYKPTVALLYLTSSFCAAEMFGVQVSIAWIVICIIMSIVLSVATPPIPGGQLASYTVLFAQLAIPDAGLAIVLAVGIILDFLETPTDLLGGQSMLILASKKFKMIDLDVLAGKKTMDE